MAQTTPPAPMAVGYALILLGIGASAASLNISLDQYGRWGARVFPLACSLALVLLGLMELRSANAGSRSERMPQSPVAVLTLLCLSIGYVAVMAKFGYLISTAIAAPAALWIFGVRRRAGLLLAAILCPLVYHLVFFVGLGVFPPYGDWFDLLDLLQAD